MAGLPATRDADERIDRLLDTAARVFADKGYHATTMRDLARATALTAICHLPSAICQGCHVWFM